MLKVRVLTVAEKHRDLDVVRVWDVRVMVGNFIWPFVVSAEARDGWRPAVYRHVPAVTYADERAGSHALRAVEQHLAEEAAP